MNEISTALKTLTDRITVKLEIGEKHFNVFLCIALCALVIYPLLFTAVVHFRTLPLGIQLLIVTGISVAYSVVLVPLSAFWVSKEWICYAPVGILSCMSGIYWVFACHIIVRHIRLCNHYFVLISRISFLIGRTNVGDTDNSSIPILRNVIFA